jgi:hypothetical protein
MDGRLRPEPDGRALSSTMYAQNAAEAGPNMFAAALRFNASTPTNSNQADAKKSEGGRFWDSDR